MTLLHTGTHVPILSIFARNYRTKGRRNRDEMLCLARAACYRAAAAPVAGSISCADCPASAIVRITSGSRDVAFVGRTPESRYHAVISASCGAGNMPDKPPMRINSEQPSSHVMPSSFQRALKYKLFRCGLPMRPIHVIPPNVSCLVHTPRADSEAQPGS